VITDLWMPEMNGIEVIRAIQERRPGLPVMVITAYGSVKTAVQAMKEGAVDYFVKPFSMETMRQRIGRILRGGVSIPLSG